MLSFYIDPARIDPAGFFPDDVTRYVAYVKSARPATPGGEVLVPGEPEERTRAKRLKDGVPLPEDTWKAIAAAAEKIGLDRGAHPTHARLTTTKQTHSEDTPVQHSNDLLET